MSVLTSTNPANNYSAVGEVEISTSDEVAQKVVAARGAKNGWKALGLARRIELLQPICDELAMLEDEIAHLVSAEIGKPISQARGEAKGYAGEFQWFLDNAPAALQDEITHEDESSIHRIVYEPFGVAAVISPWNYPFGMAIWGIVPNLIAGNTVVFKISEECPLMGKLLERVFSNHQLPEGVFNEVYGAGDVGAELTQSDIDLIWFTGSSRAGKEIYKVAADKFVKVILEMGGSNPCVVFEDADIKQAASMIYGGRFSNNGQVCSATKRLIVHESIKDDLIESIKAEIESKRVGDPSDESTDIGSLVAKRQLDALEVQVADALDNGAKIAAQGTLDDKSNGAYYPPTVLDNVDQQMKVWREEVFGPVLPVVTFKTEEEAVHLANDTIYGLGGRVISQDKTRAERVANQIDGGSIEVNDGNRWLSCNPFGGYKNSGMGREHGVLGFRELSQVKVISSSK